MEEHAKVAQKSEHRLEECKAEWDRVGWGVNPASPVQVQNLLYQRFKLKVPPICGSLKAIRKTEAGKLPTDQAAIAWHLKQDIPEEVKETLVAYEGIKKASTLGDFVTKLPTYVHEGRLYCAFGIDTDTGRLASRNPNMQNIPAGDPYGLRNCFAAPPGHRLVVADYTALELYILAHWMIDVVGCDSLYRALQSGDVYSAVAKQIWKDKLANVAVEEIKSHADPQISGTRNQAKAIVLGTNYGKTPFGLAAQLGISKEEAETLQQGYFAGLPGIPKFIQWADGYARTYGRVPTLVGRWRELPNINSQNNKEQRAASRQVVNSIIQGSAADVVYGAMLQLGAAPGHDTLQIQVHDELVIGSTALRAGEYRDTLEHCMLHPFGDTKLKVDLKVHSKVVKNWGEAK